MLLDVWAMRTISYSLTSEVHTEAEYDLSASAKGLQCWSLHGSCMVVQWSLWRKWRMRCWGSLKPMLAVASSSYQIWRCQRATAPRSQRLELHHFEGHIWIQFPSCNQSLTCFSCTEKINIFSCNRFKLSSHLANIRQHLAVQSLVKHECRELTRGDMALFLEVFFLYWVLFQLYAMSRRSLRNLSETCRCFHDNLVPFLH